MKTLEIPTDDPVKMVRAIRDKHYEDTKNMTREERADYYQQKVDSFNRRMEQIKPDPNCFPFLAQK